MFQSLTTLWSVFSCKGKYQLISTKLSVICFWNDWNFPHCLFVPFRRRFLRMRINLIRHRAMVRLIVNRKRYIRVRYLITNSNHYFTNTKVCNAINMSSDSGFQIFNALTLAYGFVTAQHLLSKKSRGREEKDWTGKRTVCAHY